MAGVGPAPKDPALRRRRNSTGAQKTLLPAGGREGRAPAWPIRKMPKPTAIWSSLWRMPQAVTWEQHGIIRIVARYALLLEQAEMPEASAALLAEVRQLEDRLGLNPKAMRSLLWEVTSPEPAPVVTSTADAKRRELRIVE